MTGAMRPQHPPRETFPPVSIAQGVQVGVASLAETRTFLVRDEIQMTKQQRARVDARRSAYGRALRRLLANANASSGTSHASLVLEVEAAVRALRAELVDQGADPSASHAGLGVFL